MPGLNAGFDIIPGYSISVDIDAIAYVRYLCNQRGMSIEEHDIIYNTQISSIYQIVIMNKLADLKSKLYVMTDLLVIYVENMLIKIRDKSNYAIYMKN